jgi:hypothetical protein
MIPSGMYISVGNGSGGGYDLGIAGNVGPTSHVTIRNIEVAGPCLTTESACHNTGDNRSLEIEHWNGSNYDTQDSWTLQYLYLHGACNNMVLYGATNFIIENSTLANSWDNTGDICHPNVGNIGSTTATFRWNEVTNWDVEGLMFLGTGTWYIYGNVWHDASTASYPRIMESQTSGMLVYFYDNTLVNTGTYSTIDVANGGTWSSSAAGRNNIYYQTAGIGNLPSNDYDASNGTTGEVHGQNGLTSAIFVNYSAKTVAGYNISSHTNAGLNLGSPYDIDYSGNTRVTWDRGAFEDAPASGPAPPTGLSAVVQ